MILQFTSKSQYVALCSPALNRTCIFLMVTFIHAQSLSGDYKHQRKSLYVTDKVLERYGSEGIRVWRINNGRCSANTQPPISVEGALLWRD